MRFRRAGSALLLALLGWLPAAPAAATGEAEWVRVDGDFVVGAGVPRSAGGASADAERTATGSGFAAYDDRENYGTFTVRLRESQGIETLRPYVAQAVREVAAAGLTVTLAPGTTTQTQPDQGEILVQVSTTSPCEGTWSGCGGPRTSMSVAGRQYWSSGQAWFHPDALAFNDHNRQHLVSHELGHAFGLRHYDDPYAGESQVMHSASFAARSYRSGDRGGLAWLRPEPPPNDHLAAAAAIGPETSVARGSNAFATAEPGERDHAGGPAGRSVWYRWTAPRDGNATFDTAKSTFDTRIAVYSGTTHDSLVLLAQQDDQQSSDRAAVSIGARAGTTYSIAVDSHHGSMGLVELALGFGGPVANDDFYGPTDLPPLGGSTTGANVGTTLQLDEPRHDDQPGAGASVWFRWHSPRDADVAVSTRGSTFDTVLAVYTGFTLDTLTPVAADDDDAGLPTSRVTFRARAGTTYQIAVAGAGGETGAIALFVDSGIDRYAPVTPHRVLDSRATRPWAPGETRHVVVTGRGGVPPNVSAVQLNVTAVAPTASGYLAVWPAGSPRPHASNLNFRAGQTVANAVQAKVGPDGRVAIFNPAGATHVLVDVAGFTAPDAPSPFDPMPAPVRLLDSRSGIGTRAVAWSGGETRAVVVAGRGGVPAEATAVVLNVTAVSPTSAGYVTAWPTGTARPVVSSLNLAPGRTVANLVVAKVGSGGAVSLLNSNGRTHLLADVLGWYGPGGRLVGTTATPARVVDSRTGLGTPPSAWRPGETRTVAVTGKAGVPAVGAEAVVLNVTAVAPTTSGYLAVWPGGVARPTASTLNFGPRQNVPNLAVVALGPSGWVNVHNALGSTHVAADVAGWFFTPPAY